MKRYTVVKAASEVEMRGGVAQEQCLMYQTASKTKAEAFFWAQRSQGRRVSLFDEKRHVEVYGPDAVHT